MAVLERLGSESDREVQIQTLLQAIALSEGTISDAEWNAWLEQRD